jgi:hypothetical protein
MESRLLIKILNGIGERRGLDKIDVGDEVRVQYLGDEDLFPNQLLEGVVRDINMTRAALMGNNPEFLLYKIETIRGETFEAIRTCLEKLY